MRWANVDTWINAVECDTCELKIRSYIHGMKLQVTKVKTGKYDAIRSYKINASSSDTCNLRIQSYIYGEGKKEKK